ncbi:TetR/AcrR family transcriptional regulator [Alisedimentitalea sp. MJ-SS2]|uniref:TetR/AcrR family transcriptional regulator n=1 Tax=Aliisedimentitalea sp. MJ-SS2 TaxID=3049795 RepID=UPI00290F2FA6|nr:TetR/AcrR family transcriptional regulator [Alisedimentitalea sp. MJ-SS2]MDU8925963.1 TetR/AcrR family transcriptional regulator [Alisedimentitalea sp. MJ-SS2]
MATKAETRREALRAKLISIAETTIARDGMDAIRARYLAKEAGCALGAIYNVFDDMGEIIIAVNGRTFRKLGKEVAASVRAAPDDPIEQLIAMSYAYLHYAVEQPKLWRTLFDIQMSTEQDVPKWYLQDLASLFDNIARPLARLFPEMGEDELDLMTRTLFSSVHGIVLLGVENRISGVPRDRLEAMIALLLRNITTKQTVS